MNFSEFKKLLGADPLNREPETLRARQSGPEFEQAATEAEQFEAQLGAAVNFDVDKEALLAGILESVNQPQRRMPRWLALAASLVVMAGVVGMLVNNARQPETIDEYLEVHYNHDGRTLLALADGTVDPGKVQRLMANWDMSATPELAQRVTAMSKCETMDGDGAHLVVRTDKGLVTLFVMPGTVVENGKRVAFDGMEAYLVSLGNDSAALISHTGQNLGDLEPLIRSALIKTT